MKDYNAHYMRLPMMTTVLDLNLDPDHRTIVEQKADRLSATQGVEKHLSLSHIDEELFKKLDHSSGANSQKMEDCLTTIVVQIGRLLSQ